ncbi:tRNA pseudouridine(55) synthase TruB [Segnochrobactrum spirostomi]|uniref:tRNA pseudouridine synthase B n=1 Tax=Segnochrobactrum spirostomi TaxID=2608987 RepID=A0A6A7Y2B6_9HYPH|nr:tRNA pseudouridine(55) synthase TruB [Segnochrobactrum spirostomi]MQT12865.1 tRNA pseudouridine(55) synthase TruB [Segnochrobactrum spirostomi]
MSTDILGTDARPSDAVPARPREGRRPGRPPQRKRPRREINGWLILDKPVGMTSTEAVGLVKRLYQAAKAGHAGTLDPLASGALPIAFGEATKTVPYVVDGRKVYRFTVRWGIETDTDDAEGRAVATTDKRPTAAEIEAILPGFTGEILQVPPRYSAIKIAGERAYDLARDGEVIELEARPVEVYRLNLVGQPDVDHAEFEAECGKGTYVRSLARDFGRRLGCAGHVSALRRLVVGPFDEDDLIPVADVEAAGEGEDGVAALAGLLQPVEIGLADLPEIALSSVDAGRIRRGQSVLLRGREAPVEADAAYATSAGRLVALGSIEAGEFVPRRVFNFSAPEQGLRRR